MKMNRQEVFDKVASHLLAQNDRSSNGMHCQYRGRDGLKCAIGVLIPDEMYTPEIENYTIADLSSRNLSPQKTEFFDKFMDQFDDSVNISFLTLLQNVHDNFFINKWEKRLKEIAKCCSITYRGYN